MTDDLTRAREWLDETFGRDENGDGALASTVTDLASLLAAVRAEGRRQGLEEAAAECQERELKIAARGRIDHEEFIEMATCVELSEAIRALAGGGG